MPSISSLPKRKQKYVRNLAKGIDRTNAARKAGYAEMTARKPRTIETEDVKLVMRQMMQQAIPQDRIVTKIAEGIDAKKTEFFTKDGVVTDQRDTIAWSERRAYIELAAEYAGYVDDDKVQYHLHAEASMMPLTEPVIDIAPATTATPADHS